MQFMVVDVIFTRNFNLKAGVSVRHAQQFGL